MIFSFALRHRLGLAGGLLALLGAGPLAAQTPSTILFLKTLGIRQTSPTEQTQVEAGYGIEVDFSQPVVDTTTVRLNGPAGISINVLRASPVTYSFGQDFPTIAALDQAVPDGNYSVAVTGATPSTTPVTFAPSSYPRPTIITNFAALQGWSGGAVVISWDLITGAADGDFMEVKIVGSDSRLYFNSSSNGRMSGRATALSLPAGTLPVGLPLQATMTYAKIDVAGPAGTAVVTGRGFALQFPILLAPQPTFTTLAGTGGTPGLVDGPANTSRFQAPLALTVDLGRNVYVLDTSGLRKISTLGLVSSITPPGTIELGSGTRPDVDGPIESAVIRFPSSVVVDAAGNFYLAQPAAHVIRKISASGVVSTLAGQLNTPGFADGTGAAARFNAPGAMAIDVAGNLYVVDATNVRIRKITPAGVVTTVAGTGGNSYVNGARNVAQFAALGAIAVDARNNVCVVDSGTIRKIDANGAVTTFAGALNAPAGNFDGPGSSARFQRLQALATDAAGNVYAGDGTTLRKITSSGVVSTLAGDPSTAGSRDGVGSDARFASFDGLVVDDGFTIYSADRTSTTIRRGTPHPLTVPPIVARLASQHIVPPGTLVVLSANTSNTLTYQWRRNEVPIAGATTQSLVLPSVQTVDSASYDVVLTNNNGAVASNPSQLIVGTPSDPGRISNLAIRSQAGTGAQTLIVGVSIGGAGVTGNKPVLLRGVGPTLNAFGVPGTLVDPKLELFSGQNKIGENDDWGGGAQITSIAAQVGAFGFANATSKDAALYNPAFAPGSYTVAITGAGGAAGVALAEIYDATPGLSFGASTPRLVNVSARTDVGLDSNILIAGFVIGGEGSKTVLVRAIGPTLGAFGVSGSLADPKLELYAGQSKIDENDNWGGGAALADAFTRVGAFGLTANTRDAALLVTLAPGAYTAQVSGANRTTGVALVEVYEVP